MRFFSDFLYKGICCEYLFELHRHVDAIQMSTHNISLYKEVNKRYTDCHLKTTKFLDCALIGVCAVIRSNTVCLHEDILWWYSLESLYEGHSYESTHNMFSWQTRKKKNIWRPLVYSYAMHTKRAWLDTLDRWRFQIDIQKNSAITITRK